MHSNRLEVMTDLNSLHSIHAPYLIEYYSKVLKKPAKDIPRLDLNNFDNEYYFKKFESKDARDRMLKLMKEAISQKVYMRPIVTQEEEQEKKM